MAKATKYSKSVQEKARRLARQGRTATQISRAINVSKRVVKGWTAPQREARQRDRAHRLSKLGRNPREIATRLDAKVADVERWLSSTNGHRRVAEPSCGARHGTETRRCARKMAELHDPVTQISEVLGVTPKTTRTWLRDVEAAEEVALLPGGRRRVHDRAAILADVHERDDAGEPRYTRAQIRKKYGCSHKFLSHLVNGRLDP